MADPAELTPVELDRIEDALEGLELAAPLDEPSLIVRRRLHDYRQILALSRAAMPMVEVPRGLLDNVLAEARAAAELPVVAPDAVMLPQRDGFWTRLRRAALLPGVALATTAALVLLMVERKDERAAAPSSVASPVVARAEQAHGGAFSDAKTATGGRAGELQSKPAQAPAPEPAAAAPAAGVAGPGAVPKTITAEPPAEELAEGDAELGRDRKEIAEQKKPDDAAPNAAPVVDQETTPRWDIIARGDRARHKSDCAAARSEYSLALGDMDARVRARAHAGLGLCEAAMGDRQAADAAYKQARELDEEIAGFIEAERPRGAKASNQAKAAKKAKAAPPINVDNAMERDDAFDPIEPQQQKK